MAPNTFGNQFRISTFGESHGTALGGVIDGCPAGLILDLAQIERELERRRPRSIQNHYATKGTGYCRVFIWDF